MKQVFFFVLLLTALGAKAQFTEAKIGVNGLTCSQCSRNVEMRLRKLDFVKDVKMNLEHTEGTIIFKENAKVNMDKVAQAVIDAGFSLRFLSATFHFTGNLNGNCFSYGGDSYQLVSNTTKKPDGIISLKFLGKNYLSKKEYKQWLPQLTGECSSKPYFVLINS